jgi:hypothetical protein
MPNGRLELVGDDRIGSINTIRLLGADLVTLALKNISQGG